MTTRSTKNTKEEGDSLLASFHDIPSLFPLWSFVLSVAIISFPIPRSP